MSNTVIDLGVCEGTDDIGSDDIESELYSSTREASVSLVPFANLDMWELAHKLVLSQAEHDLRESWRMPATVD
jgi:hypothetical protein